MVVRLRLEEKTIDDAATHFREPLPEHLGVDRSTLPCDSQQNVPKLRQLEVAVEITIASDLNELVGRVAEVL